MNVSTHLRVEIDEDTTVSVLHDGQNVQAVIEGFALDREKDKADSDYQSTRIVLSGSASRLAAILLAASDDVTALADAELHRLSAPHLTSYGT